jgi:hypothetical protein
MSAQHACVSKRRSLLMCSLLLAVGLAPVVSAIIVYRMGWLESSSTLNNGELLQPALKLSRLSLTSTHWTVWYVYPRQCESGCLAHIDKLVRLHQILGKDRSRVRLAFSFLKGKPVAINYSQFADHWTITAAQFARFYPQHHPAAAVTTSGDLFLSDPQGNVFMHYPGDVKIKAIFDDLHRVLTASLQ